MPRVGACRRCPVPEERESGKTGTLSLVLPVVQGPGGGSNFTSHRHPSYYQAPPLHGASLVAQMVKNEPTMQETWVRPLGWEDSLEEGMTTHSYILAWRILMDRGAWQTVHGVTKRRT